MPNTFQVFLEILFFQNGFQLGKLGLWHPRTTVITRETRALAVNELIRVNLGSNRIGLILGSKGSN